MKILLKTENYNNPNYRKQRNNCSYLTRMDTNSFGNILDNAIKYSTEESKIYINSFILNSKLIISVKDHGIGIDKKIFKIYLDGFTELINQEIVKLVVQV